MNFAKAFACGEIELKDFKSEQTSRDFKILFQTLNCEYLITNDVNFNDSTKSDSKKSKKSSSKLTITYLNSANENENCLSFSKSCEYNFND